MINGFLAVYSKRISKEGQRESNIQGILLGGFMLVLPLGIILHKINSSPLISSPFKLSIEQHNEHMAMVADVAIATLISQKAALDLYPHVIVAPPSPCGYAPYHMARPGTLTLRKETFLAYILDVMSCLKAHGVRTIFILNGHGGNHEPIREALPKFRKDRLPFVTTLEECSESVLDRALDEVAASDYHVQPSLSLPIFS